MQEERELMSRQQDAMREHAGPRELRMYPRIPFVKEEVGKEVVIDNSQELIIPIVEWKILQN